MPNHSRKTYTRYQGFTLIELLVVLLILGGIVMSISINLRRDSPKIPLEYVKMNICMPYNPDSVVFDVIVNNGSVGEVRGGKTVQVSFPSSLDGNSNVEFVPKEGALGSSGKRAFLATRGAELNVTVKYTYHSGGWFGESKNVYDIDILTVKQGETPSIVSASIEPETIRREAYNEVVTGPPGTKYTLTRKRTIERQIVLSETAKLELSASASLGYGLLEATAMIRTTLAQKDTVLMQDKEEITQSVDVVFDSTGTATIQWIDYIKKGKALYKFNGQTKEMEFEVLYSSELTILMK